ncbi:ABC transporter permease subunit [Brevibacillus fluminis]|uniref:ABC transporter permease subunit n=1 Tax=Brevibacillus fluminis TaxID=511487 RepID=UPI003F8BFD29
MVSLLRNENMKLYARLQTWLMVLILLLAIGGIGFLDVYSKGSPDPAQWQSSVQQQTAALQAQLLQESDPGARAQLEEQIKLNAYALEHGIAPDPYSMWSYTLMGTKLIPLVSIFVIVVAGGIVANEHAWGTVKNLLVKPYSRSKILLSKYMSVMQFALFLLLIVIVGTYLCKGIFYGFAPIPFHHLSVNGAGLVQDENMALYLLKTYGLASIELFFMATFTFMLSSMFRNQALAIGLGLIVQFTGGAITQTFVGQYSWLKYSLFANTSLSMYGEGTPLLPDMTIGFSIAVLLAYYIVFMAMAWIAFTKRDVA